MSSIYTSHQNTATADDKTITSFGELAPKPDLRPELLLRLTGQLQTTLDLTQLLEILHRIMQDAVLVDGIRFQHNTINAHTGKRSQHEATYHLKTQDEATGSLSFHRATRFREYELANIEGLITAVVYPLRNAIRYHEALATAYKDPLTGASNRVALNKTLSREVELAKRHQRQLSMLMLDLDHFKRVNDTHGHSMGDKALKEAANVIAQCIRQTDMCFRYGGEEFLVLLSNAHQGGAIRIAERIRESIAQLRFQSPKGDFGISASIGTATLRHNETCDQLLERADQAMYTAKHSGRNRVICDDELPKPETP